MKRRDLLPRIAAAAKAADVPVELVREEGSHSRYRCGQRQVTIPRHREIRDGTAEAIVRQLEPELGKRWWRR